MAMDEVFNEELQALLEMHFGKVPGLIRIEEFFDRIKKAYSKVDAFASGSAYRELISDPLLKKVADEIARTFGFKEVAVTIARRMDFNAYTIPFVVDDEGNGYDFSDRKVQYRDLVGAVTVTGAGFTFNKRKFPTNLLVCLNLGCLFKTPITTPELVAVLLHEIGHNFSLVVLSKSMTDRADEHFADQFATMYGYGPELSSALSKTMVNHSEFDKAWKDVPILNVLVGLNQIRKNASSVSDENPHPVTKNRLLGIARQLEQDLKDTPNLSPGMRKDIQAQIDQCKRTIDATFNADPNANMGERITRFYFREMEPNMAAEKRAEEYADRYSAPMKVNAKIGTMVHKKGWFR